MKKERIEMRQEGMDKNKEKEDERGMESSGGMLSRVNGVPGSCR